MPEVYKKQYSAIYETIAEIMKDSAEMIATDRYDNYSRVLDTAEECKDNISILRKNLLDGIQSSESQPNMQVSLVYLNLLQESQEMVSIMRHQLRAAYKFVN